MDDEQTLPRAVEFPAPFLLRQQVLAYNRLPGVLEDLTGRRDDFEPWFADVLDGGRTLAIEEFAAYWPHRGQLDRWTAELFAPPRSSKPPEAHSAHRPSPVPGRRSDPHMSRSETFGAAGSQPVVTISYPRAGPPDDVPHELWEGEQEPLAAGAGRQRGSAPCPLRLRRARSLPGWKGAAGGDRGCDVLPGPGGRP